MARPAFVSTPQNQNTMNPTIELPVNELKDALPGLNKVVSKSSHLPVLQTVRVARSNRAEQ